MCAKPDSADGGAGPEADGDDETLSTVGDGDADANSDSFNETRDSDLLDNRLTK